MVNFLIIMAAAAGLLISGYIHYKKLNKERIFGIPYEILGMLYYGFILIATIDVAFTSFSPSTIPLLWLTAISSIIAIIFSLYLVIIQKSKKKSGCRLCLTTHAINLLIFILLLIK